MLSSNRASIYLSARPAPSPRSTRSALALLQTLILGSLLSVAPLALGALASLLALTISASSAHAQSVTAELGGTVTDPSGAIIAKANITATNTSNGFARTVQTSDDGRFILAGLPPGPYK